MSLTTPTTTELNDNIVAQLEASFSATIPLLPKVFSRVLAKVLAGVLVLIYRYAGRMHLDQFVATASTRETTVNGTTLNPLIKWGRQVGVGEPNAAERAELTVDVTVLTQTGTLSAGQKLVRSDTGVIYTVVYDVQLDAATVSATIRAADDQDDNGGAGAIGNLAAGATLDFANAPAQVAVEVTVTGTTVTGIDAETWDDYRARIERHEQAKPQGGAYADYREWGENANGVAAIYPYTGAPGEMDVYVEAITSIDPDGIPTSTELAAALAAIEYDDDGFARRRPSNCKVNTLPISRVEFSVVIYDLLVADPTQTAGVQADIEEAADEFLRTREPFIVGLSVLPRLDRVTQGEVAGIIYEVINAAGATVSRVELKVGSTTINARTLGIGEKAKLATNGVTYQ